MEPWDNAERTKNGEAEPTGARSSFSRPTTGAYASAGLLLDPATKVLQHDAILAWDTRKTRKDQKKQGRLRDRPAHSSATPYWGLTLFMKVVSVVSFVASFGS